MSNQERPGSTPPYYSVQSSSTAMISLISGIASFFVVPLLGAIVAVITGNMAKKEIRQSGGRLTGEDMAKWGVILGWVNIGLSIAGFCLVMLLVFGVITASAIPFFLLLPNAGQ